MIESPIRIPFHLCDPAKILFFGSLYEIYHQFLENHISDLGVPWEDWFQGEIGSPIRGLETSYNEPLKFGITYNAQLKVAKISHSTVTFIFEIRGDKNKVYASTKITHCFVDQKERKKVNVPKTIREVLVKHSQS